jgi:hypothetical protein
MNQRQLLAVLLLPCSALASRHAPMGRHLVQTSGQDTKIYVPQFSTFPNQTYPSRWCQALADCATGQVVEEQELSAADSLVNVTDEDPEPRLYGTYALTAPDTAELLQMVNTSMVRHRVLAFRRLSYLEPACSARCTVVLNAVTRVQMITTSRDWDVATGRSRRCECVRAVHMCEVGSHCGFA